MKFLFFSYDIYLCFVNSINLLKDDISIIRDLLMNIHEVHGNINLFVALFNHR